MLDHLPERLVVIYSFSFEETQMREGSIGYFHERLSFIKLEEFIVVIEDTGANNNFIYLDIFMDISLIFELAGLGSNDQEVFNEVLGTFMRMSLIFGGAII